MLINMQADQPAVHEDFRSVEQINSPLIAGMHRPLFYKRTEVGNKTVVDRYDHVYQIKDGFLQRKINGVDENLFPIENKHFVATDVTDELYRYQAVDIDNAGNYATLSYTSAANAVTMEYRDTKLTSNILFVNGTFLAQRIRVIDGEAIGVVVYLDDDYNFKMAYMRKTVSIIPVTWLWSRPRTDYAQSFAYSQYPASNTVGGVFHRSLLYSEVDPIINICKPKEGHIGVSLISNWGFQLNTIAEGYFTFVDKAGSFYYGDKFLPKDSTTTVEATTVIKDFFTFLGSQRPEPWITQKSYDVIYGSSRYGLEDKWYYIVGNTLYSDLPSGLSFDVVVPTGRTYKYTWTGEGQEAPYAYDYSIYSAKYTTINTTVSSVHSGQTAGCSFECNGQTAAYDSNNLASVVLSESTWNYNGKSVCDIKSLSVTVSGKKTEVDVSSPWTGVATTVSTTTTSTATEGWIMAPNIFMDNGNMYSLYQFPVFSETPNDSNPYWSGTYNNTSTAKNNIVESARFEGIDSSNKYSFTAIEYHTINWKSIHPRSNSFGINQNFYCNYAKLCSDGLLISPTYLAKRELLRPPTTAESPGGQTGFTEYFNSNCTDMLYFPGSMYFNSPKFYYHALEASEDVGWFHPGGFRAQLGDSKWNLLIYCQNNNDVYIQGISYSESPDVMGTLITDIASVDEDWQIAYSDNACIYKDVYGKIWKLTVEEGVEISSVLDNEYIIVNTTSYWNCWDSKNNKPYHYATDYNGRATPGLTKSEYLNMTEMVPATNTRAMASGINVNIQGTLDAIGSLHTPINQLTRVWRLESYMKIYGCQGAGSVFLQPIDVFFQGDGETYSVESTSDNMLDYKFSINPTPIATRFRRGDMIEVPYTGTPVLFPTSILAKFINGSGNNDFVMMGESTYPLVYNRTESEPLFVTSKTGEIVNATSFFVIQGQYYATIDEKLYGLTYSNGYVATRDALVDIRGMHFVGNTPQIAFFWAEKDKSFYSFTGDGILEKLFSANKYSLESFKYEYYYDESTMSIFVPTDVGILVFGSENTYLLTEFTKLDKIYFTPKYTYVTDDTGYTQLTYFEEPGFKPLPIKLETSFWGYGANSNLSIDRFDIILYDEAHKSDKVRLSTRTLTDVSTQSEDKVYEIGEADWDKWTHSVLLSYSPKNIKGKGIKLYLETGSAIQSITVHTADNHTGTAARFQM